MRTVAGRQLNKVMPRRPQTAGASPQQHQACRCSDHAEPSHQRCPSPDSGSTYQPAGGPDGAGNDTGRAGSTGAGSSAFLGRRNASLNSAHDFGSSAIGGASGATRRKVAVDTAPNRCFSLTTSHPSAKSASRVLRDLWPRFAPGKYSMVRVSYFLSLMPPNPTEPGTR